MKNSLLTCAAVLAAAAVAAAAAAADSGLSPGATVGRDGVRAPGGSVRYVSVVAGDRTTVRAVRISDGRVVRSMSIHGGFGVPLVALDGTLGGLSADRRTLVLTSFLAPASRQTRFAVLRAPSLRLQRTVTLKGRYGFDALSPDGRRLFVTQYTSRRDPTRYRVRTVDLASGRLEPAVVVDKTTADAMRGIALTRATGRSGRHVYTLYGDTTRPAFVHALDTVVGSSMCIELPWVQLRTARLSLARGERELVVRQRGVGVLAVIDTRRYRVRVVAQPRSPA